MNSHDTHFRSPKTLSLLAIAGIGIFALCQILAAIIGVAQILRPGNVIKLDSGESSSLWMLVQGLVALIQFPVYIFAAVTFLMWLFRTYKNLPALRADSTEFSPGWAVGWWFIPLANLIKPFQAVRNVWSESDPEIDDETGFLSKLQPAAPFFMSAWWAFWIISNVFTNITSRMLDPTDKQSLELSGYAFIVGSIFWLIAAAFAIKLLVDVSERQQQRFANVGVLSPQEPPPPPTFDDDTRE